MNSKAELSCHCGKSAADGSAKPGESAEGIRLRAGGEQAGGCHCGGHGDVRAVDAGSAAFGPASPTRAIYRIANMDCPMEEALIRKRLASVPGITGLRFNLMQRLLSVEHTPGPTAPIEDALREIDMQPEPLDGPGQGAAGIPESRIAWRKLAWAGVLAALSEIFELLSGWNVWPFGPDVSGGGIFGQPWPEALAFLLALAAIALGGLGTFRKGWLAISNLNLNINALMAVAVTGAVAIGQFPEAAMVMVLFNVSEAIEAKALDRARNAIKELMDLAPQTATVRQPDGTWRELGLADIPPGAIVRVRPGEKIGLDGEVISGGSTVNQAPITGESMPVEKKPGDAVYGGTVNESGSFEFVVTAGASDTTLARIIHAVEEAQATRAPMQRFVDAFARYYTPAVFVFSVLWAVVPPVFFGASWHASVYTALVILVIGCPCALVISTPVTVVSGMAAATRSGILIKGGLYLEQGRRINWLALDKTGTITSGRPEETDFLPLSPAVPPELARSLALSLAVRSDHPVSGAISAAAGKDARLFDVRNFAAIPGKGVSGTIDGAEWSLGNRGLVEELGKASGDVLRQFSALESRGRTVVALMGAAGVAALFAVADTARPSSVAAIGELKAIGVKTMMLTGDNRHAAGAIAREVGVDEFRAGLLPQEKLGVIEKLKEAGNVVGMAGDGINDAPAMARADIGFAMAGGGTDTAIETADVALMDDDLRKIPRFIRLSRAAHAILVENIALALGIKAVFFALTLTGNATMWMAVFADVGAALLVVANGLRVMKK